MSKYDALYPIKLIDTYHNSATDFKQIAADGYKGVIFKAGQWNWGDVPYYKPDWPKMAQDEGLLRGWYYVCDSRAKYTENYATLAKWTNMDPMELDFWDDVEKPWTQMTDADYWNTPYAGWDNHYNFMRLIQESGASRFPNKMPGIYTSPGQFQLIFRNITQTQLEWFAQAPLWTAQYNQYLDSPQLYGAWTDWVLWQVQGEPDINHFNGDETKFNQFFQLDGGTPPPEPEDPVKYIGQVVTAGVNVRVLGALVGAIPKDVIVDGTRMWDDGTYMRMAINMENLTQYLYYPFDLTKEYYVATGHVATPHEWVKWQEIGGVEEMHRIKDGEVIEIWVPK